MTSKLNVVYFIFGVSSMNLQIKELKNVKQVNQIVKFL